MCVVCVCVSAACTVSVQTHLSHHCLTSTTLTFESNPSSPLARPCSTKDNPHRSAPAPCLLSCDNGRATKTTADLFLFFFFFSSYRATTYVKYLQQCCASMNGCFYVPFLHQGKKKDENFTSWQFDGYCFFLSSSARANKSNQCSL